MKKDIIEIKQKIAMENMNYLNSIGLSLEGKKILDVGFGLGYNAKMMRDLGAEVYGIEPDKDAFKFAINNGLIDIDKSFNCKLQDIPSELLGTFDISIIFLYCIDLSERSSIAKILAESIKPEGISIIGLRDEIFIKGDNYLSPVSNSFKNFFENVTSNFVNYNIGNRMYIIAKEPKLLNKSFESEFVNLSR